MLTNPLKVKMRVEGAKNTRKIVNDGTLVFSGIIRNYLTKNQDNHGLIGKLSLSR